MKKRYIPGQSYNPHREDPTKKPPPGWKVENILWQRMMTQAVRTGCQSLIDQVDALKEAFRGDLVIVMETITRAAKGEIDPETLNLQQMIDEYYQENGEPDARKKTSKKAVQSPVSEATGEIGTPSGAVSFQAAAQLLSNGSGWKSGGAGTKSVSQLPLI